MEALVDSRNRTEKGAHDFVLKDGAVDDLYPQGHHRVFAHCRFGRGVYGKKIIFYFDDLICNRVNPEHGADSIFRVDLHEKGFHSALSTRERKRSGDARFSDASFPGDKNQSTIIDGFGQTACQSLDTDERRSSD